MTHHPPDLSITKVREEFVEQAKRLYDEQFRAKCEQQSRGKFIAIDVENREIHVGESSEEALEGAARSGRGPFHLMRVGSPGAFRTGYAVIDEASRPV